MLKTITAFNALEGTELTEEQGWRFMVMLKYARATAGKFVIDDYEDMAAYAALAAESGMKPTTTSDRLVDIRPTCQGCSRQVDYLFHDSQCRECTQGVPMPEGRMVNV